MARDTEHLPNSNTLPPEELNPTLNPILGQNMGRWAEVYFKNPPEKRDEAVTKLLRELKGENTDRDVPRTESPVQTFQPETYRATENLAPPAAGMVDCPSCGAANEDSQRFCGMCGSRLHADVSSRVVTEREVAERTGADISGAERTEAERTVEAEPMEAGEEIEEPAYASTSPAVQNWHSSFLPREDDFDDRRSGGESFDRSYQSSYEDSSYYEEPPSRPYRLYIGAALALIMVALGYMAWRSAQAEGGLSRLSPKAPPATASAPAPAPPAAATADSHDPAPEASTPRNEGTAGTPAKAAEKAETPIEKATPAAMVAKDVPSKNRSRERTPAKQSVQGRSPEAATSGGSGAQELAMAHRYLDGSSGQRNPGEAVDWLWKAVAKGNSEATLQLSDLFLRGNGVPKNCDQARVLLHASASKGNSGAAERLRHMQAFGCE